MYRLVLRDSARMEVLPQRPPIVSPSLPVRDETEDPVVPRAERQSFEIAVGLRTPGDSQSDHWPSQPVRGVRRLLFHHFRYCRGTSEDDVVLPKYPKVDDIP